MLLLPETLDTNRLRLRKPRAADAAGIFKAYAQDPDVARYMVWRPHTAVAETQVFVADCLASWEGADRRPYVITHQGHHEPIGMLEARFHGHMADIGYVLASSQWGRGLMPEAVDALVGQLFSDAAIYRVQATCDVDNEASRRTLEKSGFIQEGRLERFTMHPNISPTPRACYLYARCRGNV